MAIGLGEGAEMWQPLGVAIIGGLTFSTALTLLVVPCVYSVVCSRSLKRERKRRIIQADED
jgi:HAE1 family hydrophobic/amphiphilic exporter-1